MSQREEFRIAIAEGDFTALLVAADAVNEVDGDYRTEELFRLYVDIQTKIRMSEQPPAEMLSRFAELNTGYVPPERVVGNARYSQPLANYYLSLSIPQRDLCDDLHMLSREPIRNLTVTSAIINDDLALLLRNYRIGQINTLRIVFRNERDPFKLNEMLAEMKGYSMDSLEIRGVPDRFHMLRSTLMCNRTFPRGFRFLHSASYGGMAREEFRRKT